MITTPHTVRALRDRVVRGDVSAAEVCREHLDRIEAANSRLNAFNTITAERALERAAQTDRRRAAGDTPGPLAGVPVAIKDNLCVRGVRTTASSRILDQYRPPYDATVVTRLEAAGAIVVGKTNCDEFAMGSSNENSAYGPVRNPWAPDRAPGGSSGGSAAAVAARLVPLALGSDTGGSIRQPAALSGVVGLKPTYGRVSRYGLIALASSLDQIGPFARTVGDAAVALGQLAGIDAMDSTSLPHPVPDYTAALTGDIRDVRIGVPRRFIADGVDSAVLRAFESALEVLRGAGATIRDIDLPHAKYAVPVYYLVMTAEASSNLARYDGVRYGHRAKDPRSLREMYSRTRDEAFGPEVKRRIMLGTYVLSAGYYDAYYLKALQVRTLLRRDYERAFETVDVVAVPTSPTPAFRLGEKTSDPLQMYLADIFTVSANLTGSPAISLPCGFAEGQLPIGLQLTGRMFDESTLLRVGDAYERLTEWHLRSPDLEFS